MNWNGIDVLSTARLPVEAADSAAADTLPAGAACEYGFRRIYESICGISGFLRKHVLYGQST